MQVKIGDKIKELRKRDGRTQEEIASSLGVTSQAVSRWEANGGYPDMEIMPNIASLFGVSIDALFGYDGVDRKKRIDNILSEVQNIREQNISDLEYASSETVVLLRNACAEFPSEERLLVELAATLHIRGIFFQEGVKTYFYEDDEDEYGKTDIEPNKKNPFWQESITLYTNLLENSRDNEILTRSKRALVHLYQAVGRYDKAVEIAGTFSYISSSREIMLYQATYGEERCRYAQEALVELLDFLYSALSCVIFSRHPKGHKDYVADTKKRIEKISGMANLFELIYDDGNMGFHHSTVRDIYLSLVSMYCDVYSHTDSENGDRSGYLDLAFECLDKALENAKKFDAQVGAGEYKYTAFLVNLVTEPNTKAVIPKADSIINAIPKLDHVKKVLMQDKRWQIWVDKVNG